MESRFYLGAGWPMRSLHCQLIRGVNHGGESLVDEEERGGIRFGDPNSKYWLVNVLPYTPVWRGFGVNTMLYAGVLWLVIFAPFVIRRRVRIKRGQCLACGYSLL